MRTSSWSSSKSKASPKPKTYKTDVPKYVEETDLVDFLHREFSSLTADGITRIFEYTLEVCSVP